VRRERDLSAEDLGGHPGHPAVEPTALDEFNF
jgi:hypothetical protein